MAKAIEVARYLVHRAAAEEEPEFLTHLRIQKLLYYVQGWSLANRKQPMFSERIEAWTNGPVVRDVYPYFARHGSLPIPPSEVPEPTGLTDPEAEFIESVWNAYKKFSAWSLREMTHAEKPWVDARGDCDPAEKCDRGDYSRGDGAILLCASAVSLMYGHTSKPATAAR